MKTRVGITILLLIGFHLAGQPVITSQPTNITCAVGSGATFSVGVSGTAPFSYQWYFNGVPLNGSILTVAGGNIGDGGQGGSAMLSSPVNVAVDATGNIFIADASDNRIRKLGTNGVITTVAGNGITGFSGDNGPATNASLFFPVGVSVDSIGNVIFADTGNNCIRKVSTNGIITTIVGNGLAGFYGDGGFATNANLSCPAGVAFDAAGNMFIADVANGRIRKVATNGVISTIAGNGVNGSAGDGGAATNASLYYPVGVAIDNVGNLLIADVGNNKIRKMDTSGVISTFAGGVTNGYYGDGGAATNSYLYCPSAVSVDAGGNVLIADELNNRIRKVSTNGIITTVAGGAAGYAGDGGAATNASLYYPSGIAVDGTGRLIIADQLNNRIRRVSSSGIISTIIGGAYQFSGGGGAATNASLPTPATVAVDSLGNLFITDTANSSIRKVDTNGIITTVAGVGVAGYSGDGGAAVSAGLAYPAGVAVDSHGNLFIADTGNEMIRKVNTSGIITTVAGTGLATNSGNTGIATNISFYSPNCVAVDAQGNLYIADFGNNRICEMVTNGQLQTIAGNGLAGFSGDGGAATNAELYYPNGVAVDGAGDVLIADQLNSRIRKVNASGVITTIAGTGVAGFSGDGGAATNAELAYPAGVTVDAVGNVFVADYQNNRIRKIDLGGNISTVAGNGEADFSGDGGAAIDGSLNTPSSVAVDTSGNLFIADFQNRRIREVLSQSFPSLKMSNVTSSEAGNYFVVITNYSGSVTSQIASLSVTAQPQIIGISIIFRKQIAFVSPVFQTASVKNGIVHLSCMVVPNHTYEVQWSHDINSGKWFNVGVATNASSPTLMVADPVANDDRRFYRILKVN